MKNFFLIVLFGIASLLPADNLGVITYVQNSSLLIRDGKTLTAGFGLPIEIFDLVQTGRTGLLEMRIMSPEASGGGIEGILRIKPKTSFSLEKNEKIRLDIFTGSFGLDVKALGEEPEWEIHAENIRLRASTANFDLTATPEGRVLVTCESGRVVCENDTGIILFAEPGVAVENISGGAYRNISVLPADLENFRKSWTLKGTEDAVNEAASVVPDLIAHYIELKEKFDLAYHALLVKRNTLDTWFREDARGALGSETALLREKKILAEPLSRLRGVLVPLERMYFRLADLGESGGSGNERFFRRLDNEGPDLFERMNISRYSLKLYAKRGGAAAP